MDANDYYEQGLAILADPTKFTAQGAAEARDLFKQAIAIDPNFSRAYGELAYLYVRYHQNGWILKKAEELADKAFEIDNNTNFDIRWNRAIVYWNQGRFDESFAEYEEARKLATTERALADLDADEAEARIYGGDLPTARTKIQSAMDRNPHPPYWYYWNYARLCYMERRYREAIDTINNNIANPPNDVLLITAASKANDGDIPGAQADIATFSLNDPDWSIAKSAAYPYGDDGHRQHWLDGLRRAGLKES